MRNSFIFLIVYNFFINNIFAQDSLKIYPYHSIYLEIEGATFGNFPNFSGPESYTLGGFSINYETRYKNVALRIGAGRIIYYNYSVRNNPHYFAIPAEILFISNPGPHCFEGGIFFTSSFGDRFYNRNSGRRLPEDFVHFKYDLSAGLQVGYRVQPAKSHFIGRIDFTLMSLSKYYNYLADFQTDYIRYSGGISLGYSF